MLFIDIHDIDVERFLGPFLDVVRSEVVGPITGVALSSINKFLAYGLIGKKHIVLHTCNI